MNADIQAFLETITRKAGKCYCGKCGFDRPDVEHAKHANGEMRYFIRCKNRIVGASHADATEALLIWFMAQNWKLRELAKDKIYGASNE